MKKGKSFEALVSWIHQCLADKAEIVPNEVILDKDSGELRQIDIAIYMTDGPYTTLTIVEVRDHKRPIGSPYIEEIASKRSSVNADAAVVVSKSGFTKPSKKKAAANRIHLMSYDEALSDSWAPWMVERTIKVVNRGFEVTHIDFIVHSMCDRETESQLRATLNSGCSADEVRFQKAGGTNQIGISALVRLILGKNPSIWASVEPNAPVVIREVSMHFANDPPLCVAAGPFIIPLEGINLVLKT